MTPLHVLENLLESPVDTPVDSKASPFRMHLGCGKAGYGLRAIPVMLVPIAVLLTTGCVDLSRRSARDCLVMTDQGLSVDLLALARRPRMRRHVESNTCGLDCLLIVLRHWGDTVTRPKLARLLSPSSRRGYSLASLQTAAKHLGYRAYALSSNLQELSYHSGKGRPCVIFYPLPRGGNHAAVVWAVRTNPNKELLLYVQHDDSSPPQWVQGDTIHSQWQALGAPMLLVAKSSQAPSN